MFRFSGYLRYKLNIHYWQILSLIILGIIGRLLPHIPNMTPLLGISFFAGINLPLWLAWTITSITLLLSDWFLAYFMNYPFGGWFTFFTGTGFFMISLLGSIVRRITDCFWVFVPGLSCGFWFWTNFGVWLTSGLYPQTLQGLVMCYVLGLPFLGCAMIGDLLWYNIIVDCSARVAELGRRAGFRFQ